MDNRPLAIHTALTGGGTLSQLAETKPAFAHRACRLPVCNNEISAHVSSHSGLHVCCECSCGVTASHDHFLPSLQFGHVADTETGGKGEHGRMAR